MNFNVISMLSCSRRKVEGGKYSWMKSILSQKEKLISDTVDDQNKLNIYVKCEGNESSIILFEF